MANSDVEAAPGGGYNVVVNGQLQNQTPIQNLQTAQNAYNTIQNPNQTMTALVAGSGAVPATATPVATQPTTTVDPNAGLLASNQAQIITNTAQQNANQAILNAAQAAYWQGILSGDTAKLAEQKAEFAANQAIAQNTQQLAAQNQSFNQSLQSNQQNFQQGLSVAQLAGSLQGPANAFTQQATLHGLNAMGLSNAVNSLTGAPTPTFQAPQAAPIPLNMSTLLQQIQNPNATPVNAPYQFTGQAVQPTTTAGGGGTWAGSTASNMTPYQQQVFNTLTANNGSPAAGVTAAQFQAYLNANNGQTPGDAGTLASWVTAHPNDSATSSTVTAPTAGAGSVPGAAPAAGAPPRAAGGSAGLGYGATSASGFIDGRQAADGTWYDASKFPNGPPASAASGSTASGSGSSAAASTSGVSTPAGYGSVPDYLKALPPPNQIVSRDWLKLDPDTQQFLLSAYQQKGYSANDVTHAVQSTLPQFSAPTAGNSNPGGGGVASPAGG